MPVGGLRLIRILAFLGLSDLLLGRRIVDGGVVDRGCTFFAVVGHESAVPAPAAHQTSPTPPGVSALPAQPLQFLAFLAA